MLVLQPGKKKKKRKRKKNHGLGLFLHNGNSIGKKKKIYQMVLGYKKCIISWDFIFTTEFSKCLIKLTNLNYIALESHRNALVKSILRKSMFFLLQSRGNKFIEVEPINFNLAHLFSPD